MPWELKEKLHLKLNHEASWKTPWNSARREHRRLPVNGELLIPTLDIPTAVNAEVLDLSDGGMRLRIELPRDAAVGDRMVFEVAGAGEGPQPMTAEIANMFWDDNSDACTVGLRWVGASDEDLKRLHELFGESLWQIREPAK